MTWRLTVPVLIGLAALAVLACGPSGDPAMRGGVIPPALERPSELAGLLDLPALVDEVAFPWSEVVVTRTSGEIAVGVLVADTPDRRRRGLMYWSDLPPNSGMIFIWEETQARRSGFWNRNVPMDLSVAWLGQDGTILEITTLWAQDETTIRPGQDYVFVMEMPRGRFEEMGVGVGDRVLIPQTLLPGSED